MMTQQLGFSVLTAPIAAIDRRALSQAWYSALHLAHGSANQEAPKRIAALKSRGESQHTVSSGRGGVAVHGGTLPRVHRQSIPERRDATPVDRRSLRSPLARKIEHVFLRPNAETKRATFTIDAGSARVHVTMQRTAHGLRLVAVCPPRVRQTVAHALEQARYALAARGIALNARVTE